MKSKKWLWILITVLLVVVVIVTSICLTRCSRDDDSGDAQKIDPRETSIVLMRDTTVEAYKMYYNANVQNGKSGQTYVFTSKANEHEYKIYVFQIGTTEIIDSSKYELKMYDTNYDEISMTYDANENVITLSDESQYWDIAYENEDVYFAITLKEDLSFKLELQRYYT